MNVSNPETGREDELGGLNGALQPVRAGAVLWSHGFFKGILDRSTTATRDTLRMALWHPDNSATFENFKTTSRLKGLRLKPGHVQRSQEWMGGTGDWQPDKYAEEYKHQGTNWSDGDCYKYVEGLSWLYGSLEPSDKRASIKSELDDLVPLIAAAQDEDGYLNTQIQIPDKNRWITRIHHEDYNLGHLLTAAVVHYSATGESGMLEIATKAADNAYDHFIIRQRDAGYFGWNPTHIPGLVDLYRATKDKRYLELAMVFIDCRGAEQMIQKGAYDHAEPNDQNQMAVPFRNEREAVGHAVTATYLYLGASEIYRETGDRELFEAAERIWRDVVERKLYVTGAVGALPVGISKRGYRVWEAFGREYQLPHRTAYNETCANISWGMFCRSMFMISGGTEYADEMERLVYNAGLSGLSAAGDAFNYANPLRWYKEWDTTEENFGTMRHFSHDRWQIHTCFCCPPQAFRFTAQLADWAYYIAPSALYVVLYGSGSASADLPDAGTIRVRQETAYPWDGSVKITVEEAPDAETMIALRVPAWCEGATLSVNGESQNPVSGKFAKITRTWNAGDTLELTLPMPVRLVTAHPKVEECRGQVAVMRGPVVYAAESVDLPSGVQLENVAVYRDFNGASTFEKELLGGVSLITGRGRVIDYAESGLYRERDNSYDREIDVTLIPYLAWRNRGRTDMSVWLAAI